MKIKGIQKTTLLDYPNKVACVLFLHGCNFRCGFCHNPELVISNGGTEISEESVLKFLKKRKKILEGVCITGGEPLLDLDINFLKEIKKLGYKIKLDTNGSFPKRLKAILDMGLLDYVAMDIKASPKNYKKATEKKVNLNDIEKSIKLIHKSKLPYEFRTTIVSEIHTVEDIVTMRDWVLKLLKESPKTFYLQGFKNSGKCINEKYLKESSVSEEYLNELKKILKEKFKKVGIRT